MLQNRSIPRCTVIPELAYPDVAEAMRWLCDAFGFTLRIQIANHRVQLNVGDGAVVLTERGGSKDATIEAAHSVMVRVSDIDNHHDRANNMGHEFSGRPLIIPMANANTQPRTSGAIAGRSLNPSLMLTPKNGVAHPASCRPPLV